MLKRQYYISFGLVLLTVLVVLNLPEHQAGRLKLALGGLFLPLFGIASSAQNLVDQAGNTFAPRSVLLKEVEQLSRENAQLRQQVMQGQDAWRENIQLRQAVGWQPRVPWKMKLARVVGQDPANWWRSVMISAGSRDGVAHDMTVLTANGLVGRVTEVGMDRSRVVLVGDPNCRFSALVQETRDKGVIAPNAASLDRLLVDLTYLPGDSLLKPGQTIVTSGDGGVFPKGIAVGNIVDVRTNDFGLYLEARVKLAVNLNHLEQVWVLLQ